RHAARVLQRVGWDLDADTRAALVFARPRRRQRHLQLAEGRDDVALAVLPLRLGEFRVVLPVEPAGRPPRAVAHLAAVDDFLLLGRVDGRHRGAGHGPVAAGEAVVVDARHQRVAGLANVQDEAGGILDVDLEEALGAGDGRLAVHLHL